jgi:hypothetical protein
LRGRSYTWWGWSAPSSTSPGTRSKRRRKAGVSKGEAKSMAARKTEHARERQDGGGGSHHGCDRRTEASWRREASAAAARGGQESGSGRSERDYVGGTGTRGSWGNPNGPVMGRAARASHFPNFPTHVRPWARIQSMQTKGP